MKLPIKSLLKIVVLLLFVLIIFSCAYMGFHGHSIKLHPDIHSGVTEDHECLDCHHPDKEPQGPPTPHPSFSGCIKCHND